MDKNPRSARPMIPAVNEPSISSAKVYSSSWQPPTAVAIHRRDPVRTCAAIRIFGQVDDITATRPRALPAPPRTS